jgi:virulence factor Mce-like protein
LIAISGFVLYAGLTGGYYREIPFLPHGGQIIKAEFSNVPNLRNGNPVRVAGVNIGKVVEVQPTSERDGVTVSMRIDKNSGIQIKRDARVGIWWRTLLGRNMEVEIEPGSPSAPPLQGAVIPRSQTEAQVEFDQLFQPLDETGRQAVRTMIKEFDTGFGDGGPPGRSIDRFAPTMRAVAPGIGALRGSTRGDLTRLVTSTSRAMGGLARHETQLGELVESADLALGVTAARRADLGATIRQGPQTLRDTRGTVQRLRATLDIADRLAPQLRPGARRLDDALAETRPALRQAAPLLRDARPTFSALRSALGDLAVAGKAGVPVMRGFTPTLKRTESTLLPWLRRHDDATKVTNGDAIGPLFSILASAGSNFDPAGHLMRFLGLAGGERTLNFSPCQTFLVDPNAKQRVECRALVRALAVTFGGAR